MSINQLFQTWWQEKHHRVDVEISKDGDRHVLENVACYGKISGLFAQLFGVAVKLEVQDFAGSKIYVINKNSLTNKADLKNVDISDLAKQSVIEVDERNAIPPEVRADFLKKVTAMQERAADPTRDKSEELHETEEAKEIKQMIKDHRKLRLLIPTEKCNDAIYGAENLKTPPFSFHNLIMVDFLRLSHEYKYEKWKPEL